MSWSLFAARSVYRASTSSAAESWAGFWLGAIILAAIVALPGYVAKLCGAPAGWPSHAIGWGVLLFLLFVLPALFRGRRSRGRHTK